MKLPGFHYEQPRTLAQALACLADFDGDARVMAGGQSLIPMLALRLANPAALIDLGRIDALKGATLRDDGILEIGALTTHAMIEDDAVPDVTSGMMRHVAGGIAWRPVRVRGTIAGSLAHADPSADWPVALLALDASIRVHDPRGERLVGIEGFLQGAFATVLQHDELAVAVEVPARSESMRWAYHKIARKSGEFAESIAAIVADRDGGAVRVALGGLPGGQRRLPQVEALLASATASEARDFDRPWAETQLRALGVTEDPVMLRVHATALYRAAREVLG